MLVILVIDAENAITTTKNERATGPYYLSITFLEMISLNVPNVSLKLSKIIHRNSDKKSF